MYQGIALISQQIASDQHNLGCKQDSGQGESASYLDSKSGHFDNAGNKINLQTTTCKYLLIPAIAQRSSAIAAYQRPVSGFAGNVPLGGRERSELVGRDVGVPKVPA